MMKSEELKILEAIEGLILEAGPDSYISMTFAGIVDVCKRNIEDDFGDSPVEDCENIRFALDTERRMHDETKHQLAEVQKMCKESMDENDRLRKLVKDNAEMGSKLLRLEHENQALQTHLDEKDAEIEKLGHLLESKSAECNRIAEERDAMADCVDGSNEIIDKADAEIVRMKFDRMTEEQVSELYEKMEGVN